MKIKPSTYFLIVLAIVMSAVFFHSLTFRNFETKLLPLILSGGLFVLVVVEAVKEIRETKVSPEPTNIEQQESDSTGLLRSYLLIGAWVIGFFGMIYLVGFPLATALFITAYLKTQGKKWSTTILLAGSTAALTWVGFSYILGVRLYPGLIFELSGMG